MGSTEPTSVNLTEATPLLLGTSGTEDEEAVAILGEQQHTHMNDDDDTAMPRLQIYVLCFVRMVEPVAYFSIFPYLNKMILETGNVAEEDVGFYSGWIESMFSLTQMILMISWGRAADTYGRKPVLVFSLTGVTIATTLFGLSKTIWQMILFRCIAGVFAGTIVTVRAMISENTTRKTQATAFSYFAFTAFLGTLFGPLLGGILCNPADQYPVVFGKVQFFIDYPYALPNFGTGLFGAVATILAAVYLEETIDKKTGGKSSIDERMSIWALLNFPGVAMVLVLWGFIMILAFSHTIVLPLFWFTDPELGGFGFTPRQISLFLGIAGLSQALWTLLAFPYLHQRFRTSGVLRICSFVWPVMFALWPVCNILLQQGWTTAFWIMAPLNDIAGGVVTMAFTAIQLAINDICPSQHTLGTLTAVSLVITSAFRALAPALFTSLFALGVREHILGGYLVWLVMIAIAVTFALTVPWLPKKAEGWIEGINSAA